MNDIKLSSNSELLWQALRVAELAWQADTFLESAKFNPFRDMPKVVANAKVISITENGHFYEAVSVAKRRNLRTGVTRVTSGYVAGIFSEILRVEGQKVFSTCWVNYINDYVTAIVPADPVQVLKLIKTTTTELCPDVPIPDNAKVLTLKVVNAWQEDLKSGQWCHPPSYYELANNRPLYSMVRELSGLSTSRMSRMLKVERNWKAKDASAAFLWCIATGVNPIRLLNYMGSYLTHRSRQDPEFSSENPVTQEAETELRSGGEVIGYAAASPRFSGGLLVKMAYLCKEVPWFTSEGELDELITEESCSFIECFELEDFPIMGGMTWQNLPLTAEGLDYYRACGLVMANTATVKEVSASEASKIKAKNTTKFLKGVRASTGNPLFDAELLSTDDDD